MKNRKEIILPSGGKCVVRKMGQSDYLASGRTLFFVQLHEERKKSSNKPISDADAVKLIEGMADLTKAKLTRCCGTITTTGGERLKIVDKPNVDDLQPGEISIEELDQADAEAICAAVDKLSGTTKEAAEAAQSFPETQERSGDVAPAGEVLRAEPDELPSTEPV